jgi:hypothetical protein
MFLSGRHAVCLDVGNFIEGGHVTPYLRATLLTDKQIVHNGKQANPRAHVIAQRMEAVESVYQAIMHQIVPFLGVSYQCQGVTAKGRHTRFDRADRARCLTRKRRGGLSSAHRHVSRLLPLILNRRA